MVFLPRSLGGLLCFALLGDTDGDAVLLVLAEGLHGVTLGIHGDASGINASLGERLGHTFGTSLRVHHVDAGVTCLHVGIAGDGHLGFGVLLQEGDEVVELSLLVIADDGLTDV